MKHEWKKREKEWYAAKLTPSIITVPLQQFIMISGRGNPNASDFSERVGVLYALAYGIKMRYKSDCASLTKDESTAITDFTVYPLEGVWQSTGNSSLEKEKLEYTIMIRQPDYVTTACFEAAFETVQKKKPHQLLKEVIFGTMEDGLCLEILHIGSFDDEPASFAKIHHYAAQSGFERVSDSHREIYLNNANRVAQSKLQTILRYRVKEV